MKILNLTKNVVVGELAQEAKTITQKAIGLLGKKEPSILIFKTRWGIHTFGMKFSIDIVICDNNWIVRVTNEEMKPNRIMLWNPKYKNVIELPAGAIKETQTSTGDTFQLVN